MKKTILLFIILFMTACISNSENNQSEITVSAAASLKDALEEIKVEFESQYPNTNILYNFGSTGTLQHQIIQGAPIDLFISASRNKFLELIEKNLIDHEQSIELLRNSLVLIGSKGSKYDAFMDLTNPEIDSITIGIPETVPAGKYAKETLQSKGIWSQIETKLIYGKDVRQVLSYVETGNVTVGIVYLTDAKSSKKVQILAEADIFWHSPITYSIGIVNKTKQLTQTESFYRFLQEEKAIEIFEKYNFKGLK